MTIPTAAQLVVAQARYTDEESLSARVLKVLEQGPGSVEEIRPEIGHVTSKTLGMTLKRLCDKGKVVRLFLMAAGEGGGPRPWVFGLAGIDYGVRGASLESRILNTLSQGPATTAELVSELGWPGNSVSAAVSDLRAKGKIRRVGKQPGPNPHGGPDVWIYDIGQEAAEVIKVRRSGSGQVAGHTYHRELAGWGMWR